MSCNHPLESIERRRDPDWKDDDQTIFYAGFCMDCGAMVEVQYQFEDTVELAEGPSHW